MRAPVLHAQQFFLAFVELVIAGAVVVEAQHVGEFDRRFVVEEAGYEGCRTDQVSRRHYYRVHSFRLSAPQVRREVSGSAEVVPRRLEVTVKIVDREDLQFDMSFGVACSGQGSTAAQGYGHGQRPYQRRWTRVEAHFHIPLAGLSLHSGRVHGFDEACSYVVLEGASR